VRIFSTSVRHCIGDSAGCVSTIPAEWQARQLPLSRSEPDPSG
jgi:hypothetical protein